MSDDELNDLYDYHQGRLFYKAGKLKGKEAGYVNTTGYRRIRFKGKTVAEHRAIFLMFNGYLPECVDHINGNPLDNRIENLREATNSQNMYNSKMPKNNKSGVKGVSWDTQYEKWRVMLGVNNKYLNLGRYSSLNEAALAIKNARSFYHGDFAKND